MNDPGVHQGLANDKDRSDQNNDRIAETCERVTRREHAGKDERQHDEHRDDVDAWTSPGEQDDGAGQYAENHHHLACHSLVSVAELENSSAGIEAPIWQACTSRVTLPFNTVICAENVEPDENRQAAYYRLHCAKFGLARTVLFEHVHPRQHTLKRHQFVSHMVQFTLKSLSELNA